ncbi:MAG: phosphotransferase [Cycloclasticus sp.]|nr:MAG: phosphotransferase [Cycloclasticus sp.]
MGLDKRKKLMENWLQKVLDTTEFSCKPASNDASFRRYFRVTLDAKTFIVMDAPPEKEDCDSFVYIADLLVKRGINAPKLFHISIEKGFLLLSDLGSESYLDKLTEQTANKYYGDATLALHEMHTLQLNELKIPPYNLDLLQQEMTLFKDWFIGKLLNITLSTQEEEALSEVQTALASSALEQPQVFVHRDYHSRNLMVTEESNPGVIDFQDAVEGPITYDLVSLYRDCYIAWPDEKIYAWLDIFLQQRKKRGCADQFDKKQFYQWFDWMGVQRHMKAIGIFSRLLLRDAKQGYLKDIPRTLTYVLDVCSRYDELKSLTKLIQAHQVEARFEQYLKERSPS